MKFVSDSIWLFKFIIFLIFFDSKLLSLFVIRNILSSLTSILVIKDSNSLDLPELEMKITRSLLFIVFIVLSCAEGSYTNIT